MSSFAKHAAVIVVVHLLITVLATVSTSAAVPDPVEQMRPVVDRIVRILTDPSLQGDDQCGKRRKMVMAAIRERFDFREMSKRVLGRQWRKLSEDEKQTFTGLFTTLLEHAYIGKIEDYSRQKVEFKGRRIKKNKAQVETVLVDGNVTIPVSYIMILKDNQWFAYDIVVENVSLVRNYMEQFSEIIRKNGFDSLVERMRVRIKELEAGSGKPCPTKTSISADRKGS